MARCFSARRRSERRDGRAEPRCGARSPQGQRVQPIPGKIKEKGKGLAREIVFPGLSDGVKERDLVIFTRQLAAMINAGLPIMEALDVLADQSSNKTLRNALRQVKEDIEAGSTLTAAMRKHPKLFDDFFVSMISAGEMGGVLHRVLLRLAVFIEKSMKLKGKVKSAMIYPAAIMTVAVVVTTVLLVFVIPVFAQMFSNVGQALPLPTQIVINLSNFTVAYIKYIGRRGDRCGRGNSPVLSDRCGEIVLR